ncbi:MAG: hypothetical protein JOY85_05710 [Acidobacteriaceae bacterium]|nr:hypothetical protein [Acidobacteriaceae bacterium]
MLIFVLFGTLCLAPIRTLSQELVDPGELKLHVAKVERTADSVLCASMGGDPGVATTEAGGKFVRVVLKGKATRSGLLLLPGAAFYAVFDKTKPGSIDYFEKESRMRRLSVWKKALRYSRSPPSFANTWSVRVRSR